MIRRKLISILRNKCLVEYNALTIGSSIRYIYEASSSGFASTDSIIVTPGRKVPRTLDEYKEHVYQSPEQPPNPRFLRVAILGAPNSGKSTLTNRLTGWRVCSVSSKVHTTRRNSRTVITCGETQIEFTDTPGAVAAQEIQKYHLESTLLYDPEKSSDNADLLAVLVDVADIRTRYGISQELKAILQKHHTKPSVLILNKIDRVKDKLSLLERARTLCNNIVQGQPLGTKEELILRKDEELKRLLFKKMATGNITNVKPHLKGWSGFSNVFMVSSLQGDGISSILDHLLLMAPSAPWKYHRSVVVRETPNELVKRILREKLLDTFEKEVGYVLKIRIDSWELDELDSLKIMMTICCSRKGLVGAVVGVGGKQILDLTKCVQDELCNLFHCDVQLRLTVKLIRTQEKSEIDLKSVKR